MVLSKDCGTNDLAEGKITFYMERRNPSSIMTSTFKSISILVKLIYDETYNFECLPINNRFCGVH